MTSRSSKELSYRIKKHFDRHFSRHARDVVVYIDPVRSDCTCNLAGPLRSSVSGNCALCGGSGYILRDSSACLSAIVSSAEPRRGITYGVIDHKAPGSYHDNSFLVVFKLEDVILDPIGKPDVVVFETTAKSYIEWGQYKYIVKSYVRDGIGEEDDYLKVLVEKTED